MLLTVGCQPVATVPKPARGGTAVEALVGAASVLNPLFESTDSTRDADRLMFQGLTTVDAQQNVVGLLASSWTISPDHLAYTFDIRSGVKWADGQPFGADDVLFTFHVLQDPEYQQPGAEFWREVGVASGGPSKVVFTLKAPSAAFPLALRIGIIPKHIFDGMAPAQIAASPYSGLHAFGTGPFRVAAVSSLAINLDRNQYAIPQPYLDHLVLRIYPASDPEMAIRAVLNGAADLVGGIEPSEVAVLQRQSAVTIQDARLFTDSFVAMNPEGDGRQFFADQKVRQALVQAVDRRRIVDDVLAGKADPDPGPIPTADWAFSTAAANLHPYDTEAAARALDAAGWTLQPSARLRSKNGVQFKVTLVAADSYPNAEIARELAAQMLQIGIELDVNAVPASQLVQKYLLGRHYQMALVDFDVGPDPDQYSLWHSGADAASLNFAYTRGWGLIDKDLEDGRAAVDPAARLAAYLDFQALMADAAPAVFLYSGRYEYAISQRVHGVRVNKVIEPSDRFQYVTEWYVNTEA
ncbi:MAG TPA: peptide ABC transporter substrate-binding protein [Candidatus Dormibacteraeota bacterium]|nr:peptide ABC transporter substrate-binding protein [Candidatus Dormibacteraeota bacterium]